MIFSKIAINRSREGLRCEPMGRYSKKSTYQGSVYLLIVVQEGAEVVFVETGGRNFENFAVRLAGRGGRGGKGRGLLMFRPPNGPRHEESDWSQPS